MGMKWGRKEGLTAAAVLSFVRLLLIPLSIGLYLGLGTSRGAAAIVLLSAGMGLAGEGLRRRSDQGSSSGGILSLLAEKLTQLALILCLLPRHSWLGLLLALFAAREGLLALWAGLSLKFAGTLGDVQWHGKLGTLLLYGLLLSLFWLPELPENIAALLGFLCAAGLLLSLVLYGHYYHKILTTEVLGEKRQQLTTWTWRILLGLIWLSIIFLLFRHRKDFTVEEILNFTPSNPLLAALTMLALFALKSISIVLYSGILYTVDGLLFPLPLAILLNLLGTVIMVTIPYRIGRRMGASAVEHILEKYPKAEKLRELRQQNDFIFVLLVRVLGVLPCDIVSLYMGAIGIQYPQYLLGCLLGLLRSAVTLPLVGLGIKDLHWPILLIALGLQLFFVALTLLIGRIYHKKQQGKTSEK